MRAYSHTAKIAVDSAKRLHMCESAHLQITVPYHLYGKASNELSRRNVQMLPPLFSDTVQLELYVRTEERESILQFFTELTGGTAQVRENRPFVSGRPLSAAKPFWKQRQWVFCAHFSAALLRAAILIQAKEETSNGRRDYGPHGAPRLQK